MIRCEQQEEGSWHGLSGEFVVATVTRNEGEQGQWLWTVTALKRPKGWRKGAGPRGAADDYWSRWLEGAALRPDITRRQRGGVVGSAHYPWVVHQFECGRTKRRR